MFSLYRQCHLWQRFHFTLLIVWQKKKCSILKNKELLHTTKRKHQLHTTCTLLWLLANVRNKKSVSNEHAIGCIIVQMFLLTTTKKNLKLFYCIIKQGKAWCTSSHEQEILSEDYYQKIAHLLVLQYMLSSTDLQLDSFRRSLWVRPEPLRVCTKCGWIAFVLNSGPGRAAAKRSDPENTGEVPEKNVKHATPGRPLTEQQICAKLVGIQFVGNAP